MGSKLKDKNVRHDKFYKMAKKENYASRAVYKLKEINKKYKFLKKGATVLDLGAAPGSWTQYSQEEVGVNGKVVAIDLLPLQIQPASQTVFIQSDIYETTSEQFIELAEGKFDVILSDMAPNTTGNRFTDAVRSADLVMKILDFVPDLLNDKGFLVAKIFRGHDFDATLKETKHLFKKTKVIKPESSRSESKELYIVAWEKRPKRLDF